MLSINPYLAVWSDQFVAFARGSPTQYRKYEAKFAHRVQCHKNSVRRQAACVRVQVCTGLTGHSTFTLTAKCVGSKSRIVEFHLLSGLLLEEVIYSADILAFAGGQAMNRHW